MASDQSTLATNLRKVITLIDRLRDVGLNKYISLPRIAVLGSQSAGKSSLLEQIVGLDFLPRGEGTVTRRPLELRLVYVPKEKLSLPYGVFEEIPGQKFPDFNMVKATIDKLTDNVAGNKKGIVDKPIVLTIFSPTCPDITIIDLPGITKIPIKGSDQSLDVEKVTKEMAARYCRDPKTIILCVIPANADISTSDGLMMARQLDPSGSRTIGVITKIDIMDRGTDAKRLLNGDDISLKLGYVGVKNRSQADINEKKTVLQALEEERKFFATSPVYSSMPSGLVGTKSLTNKLTDVLYTHIRTCLPEIIAEIQKQINEKEERLKELGPGLPEDDKERIKLLWKIINDFSSAYRNSINGSYDKLAAAEKNRLPAGHRIRLILNDLYSDIRSTAPTEMYSDIDIKNSIIKHEGDSIPGFPSIDAFLYLLTPLLEKLKEPAFECVNEIYLVLEEIASSILSRIISKAPALKEELQENILSHFKAERDGCRDKIDMMINSEIGYIFTNDVEFLTSRQHTDNQPPQKQTDPKQKNVPVQAANANNMMPFSQNYQKTSGDPLVHELRNRLDDYFSLVLRGIRDAVPKMIGYFLVKASQAKLQQTLFEATNKSESYFQLMAEPVHLVEERKTLAFAVETLKASIKMIRRDPDFSAFFNQAERLIQKEQTQQQSSAGKQNPTVPIPQQQRPGGSSQGDVSGNQTGGGGQNLNNSFTNPSPFPPQQQQSSSTPNRGNIFPPNKGPIVNPPVIIPNNNAPQINPVQGANMPNNKPNPNPNQLGLGGGQVIATNNNSSINNNNLGVKPITPVAGNPLFGNRFQGTNPAPSVSQPPQQATQQVQQPSQPPSTPLMHKAVDKAVDKAFENPAFQQGLSNAASAGVKQAVGNNLLGEAAGSAAGKLVQNQAVQDSLKNQAKEQGKAQTDQQSAKFKFW